MLDPEDPDCRIRAESLGITWTEEAAEGTTLRPIDETVALTTFGDHDLDDMIVRLIRAHREVARR
jgi:hypothetical protein